MTTNQIPRGTETALYTAPPLAEVAELRRRVRAAGYCHIDRLAIDGGPMVEPRPIRRRLLTDGLLYIVCVGLGVIAIIFTALELLR